MEKRTLKQNKALHLFFRKLADELNSKGYDMRIVLKPSYKIRWDEKSVKENLWKPLQEAMYKIDSTTQLERKDLTRVHEELMEILQSNPELSEMDYVDFPSEQQTEQYISSFKD